MFRNVLRILALNVGIANVFRGATQGHFVPRRVAHGRAFRVGPNFDVLSFSRGGPDVNVRMNFIIKLHCGNLVTRPFHPVRVNFQR